MLTRLLIRLPLCSAGVRLRSCNVAAAPRRPARAAGQLPRLPSRLIWGGPRPGMLLLLVSAAGARLLLLLLLLPRMRRSRLPALARAWGVAPAVGAAVLGRVMTAAAAAARPGL